MKDSRSVNTAPKSPLERVLEDMEGVIVNNRYGNGPETKETLIAKISDWRSRLKDLELIGSTNEHT